MSIEVTARHLHARRIKDYASDKAQILMDDFPIIEHIHVILDAEKHRKRAEVVLQAKNHIRLEADDEQDDLKLALDHAFEKTERQLRKKLEKVQDHRV
jgi:ribosomal subunit interface protein